MHDSEGSAVTTRGVFVSNADMDDRGDDSSSQGQSSETKSAVRTFTLEAHIVYMMGGVASTFYLFVLVHMFFLCFLLIIVYIHTSQCLNSCLSHVRPNVLVDYLFTSLFLQQYFWSTRLVILVFRREPYSVRYCDIVEIRVIKFEFTFKKLILISWTQS